MRRKGDGAQDARLAEAFAFAAALHRADTRKGGAIPYVSHLLIVAGLVLEDGGSEEEAVAALLHDAAEDHGGEAMLATIAARFGPRVAEIVRGCSDSLLPEGAAKEAWGPRKRRHLAHLRTTSDPGVLRVACADKVHNARTMIADHREVGAALWTRFHAGRDEQLWYYGALADTFVDRRPGSPLARELAELVARLRAELQEADGAGSAPAPEPTGS